METGRPEKARLSPSSESCRESVQRAKTTGWGRGVSRNKANRAEIKGAKGDRRSKLAGAKMSKAGGLHLVQGLTGLREART